MIYSKRRLNGRLECSTYKCMGANTNVWGRLLAYSRLEYMSGMNSFRESKLNTLSVRAHLLCLVFGGGVIHGRPGLDVVGARDFRSRGAVHIHIPAQAPKT